MRWVRQAAMLIWQMPQLFVALVMMPFLGKLRVVRRSRWSVCYEGENMSGGISLGPICYVSPRLAKREAAVRHELYGHTWDSRLFGPLYLIIIGIPSLLNAAFDFTDCYYDFWPEKRANRNAGLACDDDCVLYIAGDPKEGADDEGI